MRAAFLAAPGVALLPRSARADGIDATINGIFAPIARALSEIVFFSVEVAGNELQLIVVWLIIGAIFCTIYFRLINLRGFRHALRLVRGQYSSPDDPGEVTHFQALTTAISGTVGVGNIAHVAIAISVGGPGAMFWIVVAGFLGMASKFAECTLGVKYRDTNPDGSVSGGPMFYLDKGLRERGMPRLGRALGIYYAVCIVIGCLGIGCMFQSNQAFVQLVTVTGEESSFFADKGWLVGIALALLVAVVIIGGIKSIARVTAGLVPVMAGIYIVTASIVILANIDRVPGALASILTGAFEPQGFAGGALGVMILGFRRAAFSNEAGIGSAAIAHSAVRTKEPVSEGFVALLEPFIDTIVICSLTGLVITVTVYDPANPIQGVGGVELTSRAFASVIPWFPIPLSIVVLLFAYSTMISWSYYGLEGWIYLVGPSRAARLSFNSVFCAAVVLGCTAKLDAVLDFSDAMTFAMALANVAGLYLLAPVVRGELDRYWEKIRSGEIPRHS